MRNECEWFEPCQRDAYAYCAHPDKGVIPVCAAHVNQFRLSPITFIETTTDSKDQ